MNKKKLSNDNIIDCVIEIIYDYIELDGIPEYYDGWEYYINITDKGINSIKKLLLKLDIEELRDELIINEL